MALVACTECGKEISSRAKACPHCGKKKATILSRVLKVLAGFLVVFFILHVLKPRTHEPLYVTTVGHLYWGYITHSVVMDRHIKGHIVRVTGGLLSVGKTRTGRPIVTMFAKGSLGVGSFQMKASQEQQAADLQRGTLLTVDCRHMTTSLSVVEGSDCVFVHQGSQ